MKLIKLSLLFMLAWTTSGFAQEVINTAGTVTLPATSGDTKIIANGQSLTVTSNQSIILKDGFHAQTGSTVSLRIGNTIIYPVPPAVGNANPELNWVMSKAFNANGEVIAESKNFFDLAGNPLQSQIKNLSARHVLASQQVYDQNGRAAIQSLSAPINSSEFFYHPGFLRNATGVAYHAGNFDIDAKVNNPDPMDAGQVGTLGWYYSNNNSWDSYVPATGFPYSRTEFLKDGTAEPARSAGIGEALKMGMGHESFGGTFSVEQQLNHYLSIRNTFFNDATMGSVGQTNLAENAVQIVVRDQEGNWAMSISDQEGKPLMIARPGNWLSVSNTILLNNYKEEFILNGNTGDYIKDISISGGGKLKVYDNGNLIYQGNFAGFSVPSILNSSHVYTLKSDQPIKGSYSAVYSNGAIDRICEDCFSKIATGSVIGQDYHYFSLAQGSTLNISGGGIELYNIITNNLETNYNSLPAGLYKAIVVNGEPQISYTAGYGDISYNYYDQKGQFVASIAPNGVRQILLNGLGSYSNKSQLPFTNFNEYDKQGRLVKTSLTDAGTTEFIYRKDGVVRFSQNAEQRKSALFSYSNYDEIGRLIESGEYIGSDISFESAKSNPILLNNVDPDGGLTTGYKRQWTKIHYDLTNNSHGISGYQQDFTDNTLSWTENEQAKTWYSYDEQGRITWVIKQIGGLGTKTIDYTYDFNGNINEVAYQRNTAAERFHHYYQYDKDRRLLNVQTSTDGLAKVQQASYQYYLHGPLKRIELADNLQGIDYTYTAQGLLKSVNHPNSNSDPGKDGQQNVFAPDAFGMTLEYFNGDYTRTGTDISSLNPNTSKNYYNGNITAQSWKTLKPAALVGTYGAGVNNPSMFTYEYDDKYRFKANTFGYPNYNNSTFSEIANINREHGLSYDANGNIQTLNRNNSNGIQLSLNYHYNGNTNKLMSVDNYATYTYDELGRMIAQQKADNREYYISYTMTGKISAIYNNPAKTQLQLSFSYDENDMRIKKVDYLQNVTTYYIYDSGGNVMAIYDNNGATMQQKELPIYAGSRLGIYQRKGNTYQYELLDNLGNVRVVIDRNKLVSGEANVLYYSDYLPFGNEFNYVNNDYRYTYQGQFAEKDKETGWNNFYARAYDPVTGRWSSIDPDLQFASPYIGMGNNPVISVDKDGKWVHILAGAVIGAGYAALQMGIEGKLDLSKGSTWAKIGLGAGAGALTAAMPATLLGGIGSVAIASTSNIIDQGIDNYAAGKSVTNMKNYNFTKVAVEGVIAGVSFGLANSIGKSWRIASVNRNWTGDLNRSMVSKLLYNNPGLSGFAAGNMLDLISNMGKVYGPSMYDGIKTINLNEVIIKGYRDLVPAIKVEMEKARN